MDGYLVDTNTLSALLDAAHTKHAKAHETIAALDAGAPRYVSVIALAEVLYGRALAVGAGKAMPHLDEVVKTAKAHALLDLTRHTASEYGDLKARLAHYYLASALGKRRPRWLEDWLDKGTGKQLQLDENDLWMCAQARERNLILVTGDGKMARISNADASVRLRIF